MGTRTRAPKATNNIWQPTMSCLTGPSVGVVMGSPLYVAIVVGRPTRHERFRAFTPAVARIVVPRSGSGGLLVRVGSVAQSVAEEVESQDGDDDRDHGNHEPRV